MRKFQRVQQPDFLEAQWEAWGTAWAQRRVDNPGAQFYWPRFEGKRINEFLMLPLKQQTQDHCSFCDNFHLDIDTIEHFLPRSRYHMDAYKWENLYFCCRHCQQKGDRFHDNLLRPDAADYDFDKYFRWDFTLGTLKPNEQASPQDRRRAKVTICLYRLNVGHPKWRKLESKIRSQCKDDPLDNFAYRDFIVLKTN